MWTFGKPFTITDRLLPAGSYRVSTDEELIEGLSFPVYRRVATMIFAPGRNRASLVEKRVFRANTARSAREPNQENGAPGPETPEMPPLSRMCLCVVRFSDAREQCAVEPKDREVRVH
jgi:hypothetical protein